MSNTTQPLPKRAVKEGWTEEHAEYYWKTVTGKQKYLANKDKIDPKRIQATLEQIRLLEDPKTKRVYRKQLIEHVPRPLKKPKNDNPEQIRPV